MANLTPVMIKKLKDYIDDIGKVCHIDKAVLFGSYAKGKQSKDSDIDIAVFSRDINNSNRHKYMSLFLKHILKYRLDIQPVAFSLQDYDSEPDDFITVEIKKRGKVLYSRSRL